MPNDLSNLQEQLPSTTALPDCVSQSGYVNNHVGTLVQNFFQNSQHPSSRRHGRKQPDIQKLNSDLFHVIVSNEIDLANDASTPFVIPFDRALTKFTDTDLRKRYATLEDDTKEKLRTYPAIFAHEDDGYAHASFSQNFAVGTIQDISIDYGLGIRIVPQIYDFFAQQDLDALWKEFHLAGHIRFNELNRTHWSLKRGNLVEAIQEYLL